MKNILANYGAVVYYFFVYAGACLVLIVVETVNLAGLILKRRT